MRWEGGAPPASPDAGSVRAETPRQQIDGFGEAKTLQLRKSPGGRSSRGNGWVPVGGKRQIGSGETLSRIRHLRAVAIRWCNAIIYAAAIEYQQGS